MLVPAAPAGVTLTGPIFTAIGDLNHDGAVDLVTLDEGSNVALVSLNNGKGVFSTPLALPTGNAPSAVTVADINGDGVLDLVAGPFWYAGPDWRLGGKLLDAPSLPFQTTYSTFLLTYTGDVNVDGRADVVAIGYPGTEAPCYENPDAQHARFYARRH